MADKKSETYLNIIENIKPFNVSAVVSAYYFSEKPKFESQYEKYGFSQIMLVLDGEGIYQTEDGEYTFSRGDMFYRPAEKSSIYQWSTENAGLALISFVCRSEAMKVFEGKPIALCEEEITILIDVIKTCTRICEPIKLNEPFRGMRFKPGTPEVVLGYISSSLERFFAMVYCRLMEIELLIDESEKAGGYIDRSEFLDGVTAYLKNNLSKKLTIADICAHFGVSQTYLIKKCKEDFGCGPMERFSRMKIGEAKWMIGNSPRSFSEIAESLGFSDPAYFSKVFKKETGMTPTEYSKYVSKRRIIK